MFWKKERKAFLLWFRIFKDKFKCSWLFWESLYECYITHARSCNSQRSSFCTVYCYTCNWMHQERDHFYTIPTLLGYAEWTVLVFICRCVCSHKLYNIHYRHVVVCRSVSSGFSGALQTQADDAVQTGPSGEKGQLGSHTHTHTHGDMHTHTHTHTHHAHAHTYLQTNTHTHTHTTHVHTRTHTHHMHIYTHLHTNKHKHTHTRTNSLSLSHTHTHAHATCERWGGAHVGFPECLDTIWNWTELSERKSFSLLPSFCAGRVLWITSWNPGQHHTLHSFFVSRYVQSVLEMLVSLQFNRTLPFVKFWSPQKKT